MTTPAKVATMLGGIRQASVRSRFDAGLPLVAVEALLWVASGIDHLSDLQKHMGLSTAQASRILSLLRGRGRLRSGRWVESKVGLVRVTDHPHRRGYRISLTDNADDLIRFTFGYPCGPGE